MLDVREHIKSAGLDWQDNPQIALSKGGSFCPRVAIFHQNKPLGIIATVPNHDMEPGLTIDIMLARQVSGVCWIIHLRPQGHTALVGQRTGSGFHYGFEVDAVIVGGVTIDIEELCHALPVEEEAGWNDCPLSGKDLPTFDDMDSFLNWWDFHPGKQSFEIIDGQVVLTNGFLGNELGPPGIRGMLTIAAREAVQKPFDAYRGLLVRLDEVTALCPDLMICKHDGNDSPFMETKAAVIFHRPNLAPQGLAYRVERLQDVGIDVAVLDTEAKAFTGEHGSKTETLTYGPHELPLDRILAEALR